MLLSLMLLPFVQFVTGLTLPKTDFNHDQATTLLARSTLTRYNGSCNFEGPFDIVTSATSLCATFAEILEACPDVCSMAYGNGDADISGIGVFISYLLQTLLAIIYGPICRLFYRLAEKKWLPMSFGQYTDYIHDCQNRFAGSLALFTLAATIASLLQLRHTSGPAQATLYAYKISETLLVNLQWTMMTAFIPTLDFSKAARSRTLCFLVLFVLLAMHQFHYPGIGTPEAVTPLLDLCHDTYYGPRQPQGIIVDPCTLDLWKRWFVSLAVILPISVGYNILRYFNVPIMTWFLDFSPVFLLFQSFVGLWSFTYERQHMQVFAGASDADRPWGFGQVAAVVVALGPVIELLSLSYDWLREGEAFHMWTVNNRLKGTHELRP